MIGEKPLGDKDPMPFGKYQGKPLGEVPAVYLDFLDSLSWFANRWPQLKAYIDRNRDVIDKELSDPKSYGTGK